MDQLSPRVRELNMIPLNGRAYSLENTLTVTTQKSKKPKLAALHMAACTGPFSGVVQIEDWVYIGWASNFGEGIIQGFNVKQGVCGRARAETGLDDGSTFRYC